VNAYPALYTDQNTEIVCDQTKSIQLSYDYNLVNGTPVPLQKKYDLGMKAKITILNDQQNMIDYSIQFSHLALKGYDEYTLKGFFTF
jgi:hypothetical protein